MWSDFIAEAKSLHRWCEPTDWIGTPTRAAARIWQLFWDLASQCHKMQHLARHSRITHDGGEDYPKTPGCLWDYVFSHHWDICGSNDILSWDFRTGCYEKPFGENPNASSWGRLVDQPNLMIVGIIDNKSNTRWIDIILRSKDQISPANQLFLSCP